MNPPKHPDADGKGRGAFTLIELLVVLAITGLLAALIMAGLSSSVRTAEGAKCLANLKAISGGLNSYIAENSGQFIPAAVLGNRTNWYRVLEPYMGLTQRPWNAPADAPWQQCPEKKFPGVTNELTVGYGWNFMNFGHTDSRDTNNSRYGRGEFSRIVQVEQPAKTIIIGDSQDGVEPGKDFEHRYIYPQADKLARRHNGRGNYLFVDGHIEALTPEAVATNDFFLFKKIKPR